MGPSILIQKSGKRERKLWTKGKERHKRRWIIQYAPLVDSFVILYNGPLEKNQLIAWKRSFFLSHHALMLWEKCHNFVSNISRVHIDGLLNLLAVNEQHFWRVCSLRKTQSRKTVDTFSAYCSGLTCILLTTLLLHYYHRHFSVSTKYPQNVLAHIFFFLALLVF